MKTLLVRPVLVPTKDTESILVIDDNSRRLHICKPNEAAWGHQQIVLVSLDPNEKIEKGDLHIRFHNGKVGSNIDNSPIEWCHKYKYKKVIATQDQLSPDHIHKLVDEYNNGEMQNFEIEMDWILGDKEDENQNLIPVLQPKLTNNFITIVEKEHNIPYPEEPMEEDGELVYLDRPIGKPLEDYINQKHSQDRCMSFIDGYEARRLEESNSYTPQDLLEVMNLGMSLRQSQLNGSDSRSGNEVLYQWMQNKKEIISKTTCKSEIE